MTLHGTMSVLVAVIMAVVKMVAAIVSTPGVLLAITVVTAVAAAILSVILIAVAITAIAIAAVTSLFAPGRAWLTMVIPTLVGVIVRARVCPCSCPWEEV